MLKRTPMPRQRGLTLVELLVSMTLGVLIVMATVALYSVSSATASTSNEEQGLQDSGRFALATMGAATRMAGYINYQVNSPLQAPSNFAIEGAKDAKLPSGTYDISTMPASNNRAATDLGGDTVGFRFQAPSAADGTTVDCLGQQQTMANPTDIGMSLFSVGTDPDGEPTLKCVAGSTSGLPNFSAAQPLVRGVETLRVLYGVDINNDSIPERWLNATELLAQVAVPPATSPWDMVTAVRVGMVIRGARGSAQQAAAQTFYPLGAEFASSVTFTAPADGRLRRVFNATFQLRNPSKWGT